MTVLSLPAVAATLLPFVGAVPGSILTRKNIKGWYENIKKPDWRPPNWAFGPVWSCLYACMGYASYLVYQNNNGAEVSKPLAMYAAQLALNWSWTPVFFGQHNVKGGFYILAALWGSIIACGKSFYDVNKTAGYLMIPYFCWVSLATALNYWVWKENGDQPEGNKPDPKLQ